MLIANNLETFLHSAGEWTFANAALVSQQALKGSLTDQGAWNTNGPCAITNLGDGLQVAGSFFHEVENIGRKELFMSIDLQHHLLHSIESLALVCLLGLITNVFLRPQS